MAELGHTGKTIDVFVSAVPRAVAATVALPTLPTLIRRRALRVVPFAAPENRLRVV